MPKATKLHPKGKSSTLQKPCKKEKDGTDNVDPEESMRQFQLELCWCIQQCERFLSEKKGTEKQMQETWKVLTVLKNNNQPMIRKRQLMRTHFGDYRAKMAAEEKKLAKLASKIKISETPDKPKATFVRKSAFLTTGDDSFRFNFHLIPQGLDSGNSSSTDNKTVSGDSNTKHSEVTNIVTINDGKTSSSSTDNKTVSGDSNTKHLEVTNIVTSNDGKTKSKPVESNTEKSDGDDVNTKNSVVSNNSKNFKFSFSESQFKFNFNVNL